MKTNPDGKTPVEKETRSEKADRVAHKIMMSGSYKTLDDNKMLLVYDGRKGVYVNDNNTSVERMCKMLLGTEWSIALEKEVIANIKHMTATPREKFDSDEDLLCCGNGLLAIASGQLLPWSPDYLFTRRIDACWDPFARSEAVDHLIGSVVDAKDCLLLKETFGFILMPRYKWHRAIIYVGPHDGGKDTTLNTLGQMIGLDNCSNLALQEICGERFSKALLDGKMANLRSEMPADPLRHSEDLKLLVGESRFKVEEKGLRPYMMVNKAKLIFGCNEIPPAYTADMAFYSKWIIIVFPYTFVKNHDPKIPNLREIDTDLVTKLQTTEAQSAMLNYAREGYLSLLTNDGFHYSNNDQDNKTLWLAMSGSSSYKFCGLRIIKDPDSCITKRGLWDAYVEYCKQEGTAPEQDVFFFRTVKSVFGKYAVECQITIGDDDSDERNRAWAYKGLRVSR
jgi:putative DNA primase/helicase